MMTFQGKFGLMAAVVIAMLWRPASVAAQQTTPGAPDPEKVPMRLGPVWVKPTFALTNLGVDTNLFNTSDAAGPQEDFNITIAPGVNLWLPVASTWLNATIREELSWYQEFDSENSANTNLTAGWTAPLTRTTISLGGNWLRTRERPGFEIDARADRTDFTYAGAVEYRTLSRTFVGMRAERRDHDYAEGQEYENQDLREELKRKETVLLATFRHELTPLTSLTGEGGHTRDRFDLSPDRDADSNQAQVGVSFSPDALLNGSAKIGYRNYNPLSSDIPDYNGMIMSGNLLYQARDTTRITFQTSRDVQYSYDENQPYYVLTGFNAAVLQRLFGPFDLEGKLGRQALAYKNREGAELAVVDRVDHIQTYGGGVSFGVREDIRLGVNLEYQTRKSDVPDRNYDGFRFGMTASYGL